MGKKVASNINNAPYVTAFLSIRYLKDPKIKSKIMVENTSIPSKSGLAGFVHVIVKMTDAMTRQTRKYHFAGISTVIAGVRAVFDTFVFFIAGAHLPKIKGLWSRRTA